jgi:hypothetical protein
MSTTTIKPDFSRLNAYSTPLPDGGAVIDAEGMAIDLIIALKMAGCPREEFLRRLPQLWDEIEVEVIPPLSNGGH